MKVRSIRIYKYLYDRIKIMAMYHRVSINTMMIELMEIGILEKQKMIDKK